MTNAFMKLLMIELRRTWTLPKYIILGIMFLLFTGISIMINGFGLMETAPDSFFPSISFTMILTTLNGMIVPISALFFSAGIIAYDIKEHWLRSILARPITRTDYLMAKIAAASLSLLIVMVAVVLLPVSIFSIISNTKIEVEIGKILYVELAYWIEGLLFIVISALFSTFLSTFKNVFLLGVWMFIDNIQSQVIPGLFWDNQAVILISDFFFPNSWSESAKIFLASGTFNYEPLLWGIASLSGFGALAIYAFSRIKIDRSGD